MLDIVEYKKMLADLDVNQLKSEEKRVKEEIERLKVIVENENKNNVTMMIFPSFKEQLSLYEGYLKEIERRT